VVADYLRDLAAQWHVTREEWREEDGRSVRSSGLGYAVTAALDPTLAVQSFDPDAGRPVGNPMHIPMPRNYRSMGPVRSYDVTADGQRIVAILFRADVRPLPRQVELVLNWASTVDRARD
jgi:hypothetical protein